MSPARTRLAARAAALGAATLCGALYAQSVNLKPGLYEVVSSSQVQVSPELQARLPPGYLERLQQPHTQQLCLSDADLDKVSRKLAEERANADPSCKLGEHSVSGDKVKFILQCQRSTTRFEGSFSGKAFKAVINAQTDRGPMLINMSGRRTGDCAK